MVGLLHMPDFNQIQTGEYYELLAIQRIIECGANVSRPELTCRYDFVVDNGQLHRVQVKTGQPVRGSDTSIVVELKSETRTSSNKYTSDEVDVFLVYHKNADTFYWIPIERIDNDTSFTVYTGNSPQHNSRIASEYQLEDWL